MFQYFIEQKKYSTDLVIMKYVDKFKD